MLFYLIDKRDDDGIFIWNALKVYKIVFVFTIDSLENMSKL